MEDSETILVDTSIQSYSYALLAMYPTICRCHHRFSLPAICTRRQKGILATDTTWLLTYLYSFRSVSYHPFGSAISISHQISSIHLYAQANTWSKHANCGVICTSNTRCHPFKQSLVYLLVRAIPSRMWRHPYFQPVHPFNMALSKCPSRSGICQPITISLA